MVACPPIGQYSTFNFSLITFNYSLWFPLESRHRRLKTSGPRGHHAEGLPRLRHFGRNRRLVATRTLRHRPGRHRQIRRRLRRLRRPLGDRDVARPQGAAVGRAVSRRMGTRRDYARQSLTTTNKTGPKPCLVLFFTVSLPVIELTFLHQFIYFREILDVDTRLASRGTRNKGVLGALFAKSHDKEHFPEEFIDHLN